MEYILNVRSFFALLYKEVSVKYILRLPHHGYKSSHSFRMTLNVSLIMIFSVPHC